MDVLCFYRLETVIVLSDGLLIEDDVSLHISDFQCDDKCSLYVELEIKLVGDGVIFGVGIAWMLRLKGTFLQSYFNQIN